MLEKPDIPDAAIIACLRDEYGLNIADLAFLPLGADLNTAVYHAATDSETPYFVKLRSGPFNKITITLPKLLHDQGIGQVIAPLSTLSGQLWASLQDFKVAAFPFVEGQNGYDTEMHDHHWLEFGRALKAIHSAEIPPALLDQLQRETYSDHWREQVKNFQRMVETTSFVDPVAAEVAAFLKSKQSEINELVTRADSLAALLKTQSQPMILCHADIHCWNILISTAGQLYIVDWDTLTLAPNERDLMFIGGGLFGGRRSPQEEEALFYQGYGQTEVDAKALVYYRCERIVQDIGEFCSFLLLSDEGGEDRENSLGQLKSQFLPNQVVEIAFNSAKNLLI
jgi:spectinomycin phosphotransferase